MTITQVLLSVVNILFVVFILYYCFKVIKPYKPLTRINYVIISVGIFVIIVLFSIVFTSVDLVEIVNQMNWELYEFTFPRTLILFITGSIISLLLKMCYDDNERI